MIKDIEWRIKDLKETYEFWMKKINELPSHEIAVERQKELIKIANKKKKSNSLYLLNKYFNLLTPYLLIIFTLEVVFIFFIFL